MSGFILLSCAFDAKKKPKNKTKNKIKTLKSVFVLFKNYKDFFSIPACKLVHCACVSVDCPVISFYDILHSFVVRDLADTYFFFFLKKYIVLLEEKYDKWTNVVIITRVVY